MVRSVVFLPSEVRRALKVAAAERELTASEVVTAALRAYLSLPEE
ncbi:MAG: CopG family transcriptional regulator [Acidobacteria bacterium]|nr:MAG: CopG family transcriptional regulator [Acidobacteriota bacterium]